MSSCLNCRFFFITKHSAEHLSLIHVCRRYPPTVNPTHDIQTRVAVALGEALEAGLQNMRQSEDLQEAVEALRTEDWVEPRWPKIEDCNVDWCGEFQPIQKEDSEEPIKAARPGRNRGAKPKYDWNGLETALTFLLNKHGNPLTDAASCAAEWRSQNDIIRATFRRARTALPAKPNGQIKSKFAEMMMRWDDLNCLPAPPGGDRKMTTA